MWLGVHLVVDGGSQADHVANGNRQEQNSQNWQLHVHACTVKETEREVHHNHIKFKIIFNNH